MNNIIPLFALILLGDSEEQKAPALKVKPVSELLSYCQPMELGQIGKFGQLGHVLQVVDKKTLLFQYSWVSRMPLNNRDVGATATELIWLEGVNTEGVTDGKGYKPQGLFTVAATKQYKTAIGGKKTIFLVRPATDAEIKLVREDEERTRRAEERDALRRKQEVQQRAEEAREQKVAAAKKKAAEAAKREAGRPEREARSMLRLANGWRNDAAQAIGAEKDRLLEKAKLYYRELVKKYPDSKAAAEAKKALKELE